MFNTFIAFSVCVNAGLCRISVPVLSFLEYLVVHNTSVSMVVNYLSALRAMCVLYHLPYMVFDNPQVKLLVKWSKTMQSRDKAALITLPRLDSIICPFGALQDIFRLYNPGSMDPLF